MSLKCQGAAVTLSYPHFYLAESQADYFTGLNPDPEKHRLYLNVEPHTGMTLKLHSRIQVLEFYQIVSYCLSSVERASD